MTLGLRREWHKIDLICRAGMDIATLSPLLCRHIRQFSGAAAAAIFWMDERGMPTGFHHEDSPTSCRDLFINEFDHLFVGDAEINVAMLARTDSSKTSVLLSPPAEYYRSNTFNLLVRPSGHYHSLDLRVSIAGNVRVIILVFREERSPFSFADAQRLRTLEPCIIGALQTECTTLWQSKGDTGQMIIDAAGDKLLYLNDAADFLLKQCTLVGQGVNLVGTTDATPMFVRKLCIEAEASSGSKTTEIFLPSGRLTVTAHPMRQNARQSIASQPMVITLEQHVPRALNILEALMDAKISPIQRRIAFGASQGLDRNEVRTHLTISEEAMKKHLSVIYATFGLWSWENMKRNLAETL